MEQLKQYYEKVILGVALVALLGMGWTVWTDANEQSTKIQTQKLDRDSARKNPTALGSMKLTPYEARLGQLDNPPAINLANPHNLFNPVQWRITKQNTVVKVERGNEVGAGAVVLENTHPLHLQIEFSGVTGVGADRRYRFRVTRQAAKKKKDRLRVTTYAYGVGQKDSRDIFTLARIEGSEENPEAALLRLTEDQSEEIRVEKSLPFQRVDGHTADLYYPLENKRFRARREGDQLFFAEDNHKIVAIHESGVVLSAASTSKRTNVRRR